MYEREVVNLMRRLTLQCTNTPGRGTRGIRGIRKPGIRAGQIGYKTRKQRTLPQCQLEAYDHQTGLTSQGTGE